MFTTVGAIVSAVFLVQAANAAWWPFGDLGNTGLFNGWNQNSQTPLQAAPQAAPQPQQQRSFWPFQTFGGGNLNNLNNNFGGNNNFGSNNNFGGNADNSFPAMPQQSWSAQPASKIDWDAIDDNTANTTEKWVQMPNGMWQLVRETVRKADNGNGSSAQNYEVSSVYTSDKSNPDMIKKVLPQVDAISNRFGIPINIDQPQWIMAQEQTSASRDTKNPPPRQQLQLQQLQQLQPLQQPVIQQRPVVLQVIDNSQQAPQQVIQPVAQPAVVQPLQPAVVQQQQPVVVQQPWNNWDNNQARVVPIFQGSPYQQPVEVSPIRVVPVQLPHDQGNQQQPNAVVNLNGQPYPRPVIIDFKPPQMTTPSSD